MSVYERGSCRDACLGMSPPAAVRSWRRASRLRVLTEMAGLGRWPRQVARHAGPGGARVAARAPGMAEPAAGQVAARGGCHGPSWCHPAGPIPGWIECHGSPVPARERDAAADGP
ncbi:MAG: hypothetical protein M3Y33_14290 [Actinomycetota bacterium]|nr:hypothetical protein [Actinomycetota bacterium]